MGINTMPPGEEQISIVPPLKWAGGKRWFASNFSHLLPEKYSTYIEPFLGSGALYFSERPTQARLSDVNSELIDLYCVIRDYPDALKVELKRHQRRHDAAYYYSVRASKPRALVRRAARTLYLNRTCWNGLYRVNLRGEFNVPKGTKDRVLLESDDFHKYSRILSAAEITCCDFERSIDSAECGDFVFVDPPYTVAHNNNGFIKYNQNLFKWEDQVRLRDAAVRAANRGAKLLITNAAHASVADLYKEFDVSYVKRSGVIAGDAKARGIFTEMVARCY